MYEIIKILSLIKICPITETKIKKKPEKILNR